MEIKKETGSERGGESSFGKKKKYDSRKENKTGRVKRKKSGQMRNY